MEPEHCKLNGPFSATSIVHEIRRDDHRVNGFNGTLEYNYFISDLVRIYYVQSCDRKTNQKHKAAEPFIKSMK